MKKIFTMAAIAAATILAVSCAKEIEEDIQKEGIIAHASLQPVEATKASGQYSYNIVWDNGDKIAVLDKANNKASFKLTAGEGTTTGTFQQEGSDALTAPLTAYYPASMVAEDKSLEWPATQADVKNISNVPMTAESSTATGDVNFAFKHLGSVLQLVLTAKNGEINVKQIDITADQGLSGAFTVENGVAKISSTGTTITTGDISAKNIKLSATASYLNFAVPAGDFTNFKITITDIHDKAYSLSAASLTLNRAMVNKVTFAIDAKEPAVFELDVNGHTVRVQLADDIAAHDVLVDAYADGNSIIVSAFSKSGHHLKCAMPDGEFCTSQSKTDKLVYTFTLSDIESDITATIGYAQAISPTVSPENAGTIEVEGDLYEGETVILHSKAAYEYGFDRWKDQNGDVLSDDYDYTVRLSQDVQIAACFKENLILDGVFTIDGDGRKVKFTRGNLYYDDGVCKVEQYLYDGGGFYTNVHVSHFTWCEDIENASKLTYDSSWDGQNTFFANDNDFTVEGFNTGDCFALSKNEWSYLLNGREASTVNGIPNARYFKGCIPNENGESINGLFILPDAFTWPASVKTQPTGINNASAGYTNTYTYNDFKRLQDAGIIYILAAGYRYNDLKGISDLYRVGYYWSFNYDDSGSAYSLRFDSSSVTPDCSRERSRACAVRLVTEVK